MAIVGASVIPMDTERVLADHTVVVAGGSIIEVGPQAEISLAGYEVVDGRGRYLLPGLADMHVHLWDSALVPMYLTHGITTVRNMWGDPVHLALRRRVAEGATLGPRLITASPGIDGLGPDGATAWPGGRHLEDPAKAGMLVADFARRGFDQIKVYTWLKPPVLDALGAAAAEEGLAMVGHCPASMTFERALKAGMACFEHLENVEAGRLTAAGGLDGPSMKRLARQMADGGVWNCPTLVLARGADGSAIHRLRAEAVAVLHAEGAPLLAGSDTPNDGLGPGEGLHRELGELRAAGLSPFEALACATTAPARFLGHDDEGTVAPGNRADLVLVRRNPLVDLTALAEIEAVVVAGRLLRRADLDAIVAGPPPRAPRPTSPRPR